MKISLTQLLKRQKISMLDFYLFQNLQLRQYKYFFFDAEMYRHHTGFTIKIVFDWFLFLSLIFILKREEKSIFLQPNILIPFVSGLITLQNQFHI
jgi:hypothetical protein